VIAVLILVLGLWTGGVAAERQEGAMPSVQLTVQGDKVSANIEQVPLGAVLTELARQAALTVYITPSDAKQTVSAKFEALSLAEGIKRILQNKNYALITAPTFSSEGKPIGQRVEKIRVLSQGEAYTTLTGHQEAGPAGNPPAPQDADALAQLKRDALEAPDAKARIAALDEIAKQQKADEDVATVVVTALQDTAPEVRRKALFTLPNVVPAAMEKELDNYIAEVAQTDASPTVRATALMYLASTQATGMQDYLQQALQDPDQLVRQRAQQLLDAMAESKKNEMESGEVQLEESPPAQLQKN
jgi:type II secretory pathway component GspD/PulD (secretin)